MMQRAPHASVLHPGADHRITEIEQPLLQLRDHLAATPEQCRGGCSFASATAVARTCADHSGAYSGVVRRIDQDEAARRAALAVKIGKNGPVGLHLDHADAVQVERSGGLRIERFNIDLVANRANARRNTWLACFSR